MGKPAIGCCVTRICVLDCGVTSPPGEFHISPAGKSHQKVLCH